MTVSDVAIVAGDTIKYQSSVYGSFVWGIHVRYNYFEISSIHFLVYVTEAALQNFNVQINKAIPGYDDLILSGQAIDDCAASCQNQEEWVCNSFEYCIETGYCVLSKLHPDERPGIVVNKQLCDLYSSK